MADKGNSSGSDSEPSLSDWTVVDGQGDVEGSETSSTSSSLEFVQLEENAAVYVRKEPEKHQEGTNANATVAEPEAQDATLADSHSPEQIEDIGPQSLADEPEEVDEEDGSEVLSDNAPCVSLESDFGAATEEEHDSLDETAPPGTTQLDQDEWSKDGEKERKVEKVGPEVPSGSDSDSDFVKLEPSGGEHAAARIPPASDMETSTSSSRSSTSSISTNFRFVHPMLPPHYQIYREASDEEDSLPGDIDDRCESDISGVADDDSLDGDLSSMNYCIGDIPLTAGRRLYRHSPNPSLNSILTAISMATLFIAIGIGAGHYLGVSRESSLRRMQVSKMKIAQDNHLMCLKHATIVKERLNRLKDAARFAGGDQGPTGQDLKTCGDVWRQKYENIMVQNSKLELRIQELEARDVVETQLLPTGYQPNPGFETDGGVDLQDYVKSLREELNKAELENADLRREVSRLRYSAHPAKSILDSEINEKEMKLKMNQLVTENSDLKSAVGKMRYSSFPNSEVNVLNEPPSEKYMVPCSPADVNMTELQYELTEVHRQLAAERKLNIMLRLTLAKRAQENATKTEKAQKQQPSSALMKCYQLLGPEIINKTSDYIGKAKTSAAGFISLLANGTKESRQRLTQKWESIVSLLESQDRRSIKQHLGTFKGEVMEFLAMLSGANDKSNQTSAKGTINKTATFLKNITKPVAAHFQDYMNKTKQTVSKLSNTLQATWQVVRNLSDSFIEKHSDKVKDVKEGIVEKAKTVQHQIKEKWETVKGKMEENGWFGKQAAEKPERHQHPKHHPKKARYNKDEHKQNRHHQKQNQNNGFEKKDRREYDPPLSKDSAKRFEDKPNHKQRQSNHEQYNEFWRKVDFDPDDYFHEGFFEGNQREWRKHQERLRHLHNRIHRLNEDILYSMDDDDIEDIYEDLDDLMDDIDDEDQPQTLQTWLACQVRWWKSRLQRKHRSQDLVKGCGRQIMQWQLRALCKDVCVGKRCSKKKYNLKYLPLCREVLQSQDYYCLKRGRVIECHGSREGNKDSSQHPGIDDLPDNAKNPKVRPSDEDKLFMFSHPIDSGVDSELEVNNTLGDQEEEKKEPEKPNIATDSAHAYNTKVPEAQSSSEDEDDEDSSWLFERAVIREYHHQNPDWLFQRAAQRDFERTKPWYVGRSEGRELLRLKHQEKQAD